MPKYKLQKIDELLSVDHTYIKVEDECYHLMEYYAHEGFNYSDENSLIINFKKPVAKKGDFAYRYKGFAINKISNCLIETLPDFLNIPSCTFVPIPPSKTKQNQNHDDRMMQVLHNFSVKTGADCREVLVLTNDMQTAHESNNNRPTISEIQANLEIDEQQCENIRQDIWLVDDVLTNGSHFIACRNVLAERFPDAQIFGLFIARRTFPPPDFSEFESLFD